MFIKGGEGGKGRGMRGKVREADNVADFSQIFNKLIIYFQVYHFQYRPFVSFFLWID